MGPRIDVGFNATSGFGSPLKSPSLLPGDKTPMQFKKVSLMPKKIPVFGEKLNDLEPY